MIGEKMQEAMNRQLNREMYSAYLYLSMSAYFENNSLKGFANWMRVQAQEEMAHAMKFYNFIIERGGRVTLGDIEAPPSKWDSPLDVFENVAEHERKVTGLIHDLVNLAISEKDHASNSFLQWFVSEQVEEEASADEVVDRLKMIGKDGGSMFMYDREMLQRVFNPPASSG